jgi:hypothetical protein
VELERPKEVKMAGSSASVNATALAANHGISDNVAEIPIPAPRARILARIGVLAGLIGSSSDPLYCGPNSLPAGLRLESVRLSIIGTACRRPLLWEEAQQLQEATDDDIIIVRLEQEGEGRIAFTYDLLLSRGGQIVENCQLWKQPNSRGFWLLPMGRNDVCMRLEHGGVRIASVPFLSSAELHDGFASAVRALNADGWDWRHG